MFQLVHAIAAISRSCVMPSARRGVRRPPRDEGAGAAAQADADQEHRQDDRERVGRPAEQQREQPRPHHLGAERAHPRQARWRGRSAARRGGTRRRRGRVGRRASRDRRRARLDARQHPGSAGDGQVQRHGDERRERHVVHAQQVEAREQAAEHGADRVAAVEVTRARRRRAAWSRPSARRRAASRPSSPSAGSGRSPRTGRAA